MFDRWQHKARKLQQDVLIHMGFPATGAARQLAAQVRADRLTYLGAEALCELHEAARMVEYDRVPGILVEAGCALGGSAIVLTWAKARTRPLHVYDVFGLIPPPSDADGADAHQRYNVIRSGKSTGLGDDTYYGYQKDLLPRVRQTFTDYGVPCDAHHVTLVQGLFEETMTLDQPVALAHIDCDWYTSVKTCLERIVPHLAPGGRLVIDDYHHYSGCRKAVDEYFAHRQDQHQFIMRSRLHIVRVAAAMREAA